MEQHNNHFMRPTNAGYYILQKVKEYHASSVVSLVATQVHRTASHIGWKPPDDDWIKLNTDGACKERSAYVAELWGVLEGLNYAWRLGIPRVELNVDSAAVVKVINEGGTNSAMGYSLVKDILRLLSLEWEKYGFL
ncbi:putative non-LTR retroelement reverse transcriptase [Trifolium medium]|uniref:Putative non-LTR retroelement reverse transcriptase n=1 Tax=Trifolium medium TaxID=97028 RepID=A0A392PQ82_9FABA|nr:putative non-LTR retroelement reverse transcriptase [Trifolium medium]